MTIKAEEHISFAYYMLKKMNIFPLTHFNYSDLESAALYGLVKAANSFKGDIGTTWTTYAARVIKNEVFQAIRRERKHHECVSIETPISENYHDGGIATLADCIPEKRDEIEMFLWDSAYSCFIVDMRKVGERFTKRKQQVFNTFISNPSITQRELATQLGLTQSYVCRVLEQIRKVLRPIRRRAFDI
jgi:RNA polymerase sigma factor (sigma-70 family)